MKNAFPGFKVNGKLPLMYVSTQKSDLLLSFNILNNGLSFSNGQMHSKRKLVLNHFFFFSANYMYSLTN